MILGPMKANQAPFNDSDKKRKLIQLELKKYTVRISKADPAWPIDVTRVVRFTSLYTAPGESYCSIIDNSSDSELATRYKSQRNCKFIQKPALVPKNRDN